ncbi:DUF6447 family protein [Marinomonas fungiae]|uniref:Uncharacterized protein n=1 Tax=Marinomonas fungiae TaxID=1137284 RepID=A0A0K6II53_9GAMM|nr:DUF6447 family protein [Marinomonas fungiae]CUB02773.1 hypothetical protein Ga0061065_102110 [Marinomonas fungiae]
MATITIDGKSFDLEKVSDKARAQISSLQVVEKELNLLQSKIAMTQTARNAYASSLAPQLPKKAPKNAKQTVTIDGTAYSIASFSDQAKALLSSLDIADKKLDQLQKEVAITQTARNAYAKVLQSELN